MTASIYWSGSAILCPSSLLPPMFGETHVCKPLPFRHLARPAYVVYDTVGPVRIVEVRSNGLYEEVFDCGYIGKFCPRESV